MPVSYVYFYANINVSIMKETASYRELLDANEGIMSY